MGASPLELANSVHEDIKRLCTRGDELAGSDRHEEAIVEYNKAWKLVPKPKNDWEAATWILAAIADSCFHLGKNKSARQALEYAMTCPGGVGNPFLHLRLGQVLFEQAEEEAAADELMRAFMGGGSEVFSKEDPKYLEFLKGRARI